MGGYIKLSVTVLEIAIYSVATTFRHFLTFC